MQSPGRTTKRRAAPKQKSPKKSPKKSSKKAKKKSSKTATESKIVKPKAVILKKSAKAKPAKKDVKATSETAVPPQAKPAATLEPKPDLNANTKAGDANTKTGAKPKSAKPKSSTKAKPKSKPDSESIIGVKSGAMISPKGGRAEPASDTPRELLASLVSATPKAPASVAMAPTSDMTPASDKAPAKHVVVSVSDSEKVSGKAEAMDVSGQENEQPNSVKDDDESKYDGGAKLKQTPMQTQVSATKQTPVLDAKQTPVLDVKQTPNAKPRVACSRQALQTPTSGIFATMISWVTPSKNVTSKTPDSCDSCKNRFNEAGDSSEGRIVLEEDNKAFHPKCLRCSECNQSMEHDLRVNMTPSRKPLCHVCGIRFNMAAAKRFEIESDAKLEAEADRRVNELQRSVDRGRKRKLDDGLYDSDDGTDSVNKKPRGNSMTSGGNSMTPGGNCMTPNRGLFGRIVDMLTPNKFKTSKEHATV